MIFYDDFELQIRDLKFQRRSIRDRGSTTDMKSKKRKSPRCV